MQSDQNKDNSLQTGWISLNIKSMEAFVVQYDSFIGF